LDDKLKPNGKPNRRTLWLCCCSCGQSAWIEASALKNGKTKSCGCLRGEKHGMFNTDIYRIWQGMKKDVKIQALSATLHTEVGALRYAVAGNPLIISMLIWETDRTGKVLTGLTMTETTNQATASGLREKSKPEILIPRGK
jgi:hypothetical protein